MSDTPPQPAASTTQETAGSVSMSRKLLHGVAWSSVFVVIETLFQFIGMLIWTHLIPPFEYGRFAVVKGLIGLLNMWCCGQFMQHALQHGDEVEPDWSAHWSVGLVIQTTLALLGGVIALGCRLLPRYRSVAKLMAAASLIFLLEAAGSMDQIKLRRELRFQRLNILLAISIVGSVILTISLAWLGWGAWALLTGWLFGASTFAVDLLLIQRWRPVGGLLRWPDWRGYTASLKFGLRQAASGALLTLRSGGEALLFPVTVGMEAMGFWNRAQGLYRTTLGRLAPLLLGTVYPALPRYASRREEYPRQATFLFQLMIWAALPAAVFLGLEGPLLLRVFYGYRWLGAIPLIWPAVWTGFGGLVVSTLYSILLADNRLATCTRLDLLSGAVFALVLPLCWTHSVRTYVWGAVAAQAILMGGTILAARSYLQAGWYRWVLWPPLVATTIAAGVLIGMDGWRMVAFAPARLACATLIYGLCAVGSFRGLFPSELNRLLERVPVLTQLRRWLRLPTRRLEANSAG